MQKQPETGALLAFFAPFDPKAHERPPSVIIATCGAFDDFAHSSRYVEDHFVNETCNVALSPLPLHPGLWLFYGEVETMGEDGVNLVGAWSAPSQLELQMFAREGLLPWDHDFPGGAKVQ